MPGHSHRGGRLITCRHTAAKDDRTFKSSFKQRADKHRHNVSASRRETRYRNILWVATEHGDVLRNPIKSHFNIEQRIVTRSVIVAL